MEIARKGEIRKEIAGLRKKVTPEEKQRWDTAIQERLFLLPQMENISGIFCYIDIGKEAGTKKILEELWRKKIPTAVPRVTGQEMAFSEIFSWRDVRPGYMGILEPLGQTALPDGFDTNPLILVPAVALDLKGNRIGYGGGYYDRFLGRLTRGYVVSLVYEFQIYEDIQAEEHDRAVDGILTPKRFVVCRRDRI